MKHVFTFLLLFASISLRAQIVFDGSPGEGSPPPTLGGYTMTPVVDNRPNNTVVSNVASPISGSIAFSPSLTAEDLSQASFVWGNGYMGKDYYGFAQTITLTLPANTKAFYFYATQESVGATYNITATTQNNSATSGPIPVTPTSDPTNAHAKYFGFYVNQPGVNPGVNIETITITVQNGSSGLIIGQFGIFQGQCSSITPTLTASNGNVQ